MKFLKFILPVFVIFCFTGCLDIVEDVSIKKDGSGTLVMDMDMSQMVEMLKTYMSQEDLAKKGMEKMDTTIYLKDIVDTSKSIPADKKALLRPGSVHVKLNLDEKVFTTHMQFPFTSLDNLQKLYTTMSDGSMGGANLLGGLAPGGQDGGSNNPMGQFNGIYDFTIKDGTMIKKLNQDKWKKLKEDPTMAQMQQASSMGVEVLYTTKIEFPRPVKTVDNPLAKLSDDKKTVTLKYNLIDIFEKPDQFNYNIQY